MTKMEDLILKIRNLFAELTTSEQHMLIRAVTTDKIEQTLPKIKNSHYDNHGRLYAISDSKRQKILTEIFMGNDYRATIKTNSRHFRHLDTVVFKVLFGIILYHLRFNTPIIEKYPEYFI